ncbi:exodeoxyribonuclease I [Herbaspirillum sp. SJZ107]|uniref:exodeoxyribonuclease I n=1 Tax=Herbaspirillum sp. SJZ107 TaxID=2572881 RepID=UPI00114ECA24|nr:exodeoxyribonuclease I [Herbaspirillum sp. SJZ107]TQK03108.1 exodeoxyribonuclease I subunit C [Herbaspirillum sp. SJZ107]
MHTLLVFDFETTGTDTVRDRPVQFACVRTDLDLEIVGNPTTLHCRPTPDHLPDPAACLLNGITPQFCQDVGLPELQFVDAVHRELAAPGTISFGYNSIAFDDEIVRFMLWRNLMDPYAREWKDGCRRWDLLHLVRATYALRPDTLEWPRNEDGTVSFSLARMSAANGLLHQSAHDALSDVYATLSLARRIRERQPRLYAHCFSMIDKNLALGEMDVALHQPFIHVGRNSGRAAGVRILLPLAQHPVNRNEVIAWDLAADPRQLLDLDAETLRRRLAPAGDEGEVEPIPLVCIAANQSPPVFRNLSVLSRERAAELEIDVAAALANVPVTLGVLETVDLARLLQAAFDRPAPECDPEQALYAGFIGNMDRRALDTLRTMDPGNLAAFELEFSDPRLGALFLRYKARHYPQALSRRERDKWEEYRFDKLVTGECGSRTVAAVRASVAGLRGQPADPAAAALLDDVVAWTDSLAAEIDPFDSGTPAPPVAPETLAAPEAALQAVPPQQPVQPDFFGGADTAPAPAKRRATARRR